MSFGVILLIATVGALVCLGLLGWLVRWLLTGPGSEDEALSHDPLPRMTPSRGPWVWNYLRSRFGGTRRLTYGRDRRGRFRKRDR